jgi:RNA polymerase sigma-70 factor (family 1)
LQSFHDDKTLGVLLSKDDVSAFDTLYHKYYRAVFANIFKLVRQQEAAEDLLQEVFAALWEKRKSLDDQRSVGGWLFVVSYNKAIRFLQRSVREKMLPLEEHALDRLESSDPTQQKAIDYQFNLLHAAIENLPPAKRRVFILCKLEGKTYEQAARETGISPHTVKEYLSAASKFVKAYSLHHYALQAPVPLSVLIALLNHL